MTHTTHYQTAEEDTVPPFDDLYGMNEHDNKNNKIQNRPKNIDHDYFVNLLCLPKYHEGLTQREEDYLLDKILKEEQFINSLPENKPDNIKSRKSHNNKSKHHHTRNHSITKYNGGGVIIENHGKKIEK